MKIHISKWYLDCIAENGNLFLGYEASISFAYIPLHLASRLTFIDGEIEQQTKCIWLRQTSPVHTSGGLTWNCPPLQVKGSWEPLLAPVSRRLFEGERGIVQWNCYQPLATARVALNRREEISGLGYVERLNLTLPPQDIGLIRLRWGRFTAPGTSIIWIQWSGSEQRLVVLFNGITMNDSELSENDLVVNGSFSLRWTDAVPMRSGPVEKSVLGSLPVLKMTFPSWIRSIRESKWRSKGELFVGEYLRTEGWIIHETVDFDARTLSNNECSEGL